MADALFCASFFNACLRHADDVTMANVACLVNQTGPLHVHPEGIVKRTHFHTMAMYAGLLQENVAPAEIESDRLAHGDSSVAMVDAIATVDDSGATWTVAMINRHPSKAVRCTVSIGGAPIDGTFRTTVLTGDSPDAFNDIEHPNRVTPQKTELVFDEGAVSLPPHSLSVVELSLKK